MQITVQTLIHAPLATVWRCWTTPEDILAWNAASEDWHTTEAEVDLREGGRFRSRMEARDGSMAFDFEGVYTAVIPMALLEAEFGGRRLLVEFAEGPQGVTVRETFDAEDTHPVEMQRSGWQAILDRFKAHAEARA
ncbi:SRPBCC family protein [Gemmobacter caeruleus]|uniref:SRPBCC family protein n=1 Tax=Gemmobacter caeruleus TaxID=2595004 RepID=UPI0011EFD323|nr:SRPBCC family protein [Gemmobacter caeruleus]